MVIPGARFSEWSQAAMMGDESGGKWDLHFLSVYHDSDGHLMDQAKDLITGRVLSQWWDKAEESGPAARASEPFCSPTAYPGMSDRQRWCNQASV